MRLHLCVVSVLTSVACGTSDSPLASERGVRPRAAVMVSEHAAAAGSSAAPLACADCGSGQVPAVPHSVRRTQEARAAIRVGEKHELMISIDLSSLPQPSADCSHVTLTVVGPRAAASGESVSLTAHAGELAEAEARYEWSGPAQLVVTSEDSARLDCDAPATHALVLRLISPEACRTELPFEVSCTP